MYLLDTNIISELRKAGAGRADPNVVGWAQAADAQAFFISAVTVLELDLGVRRAERRDAAQGHMLRTWLTDQVLPAFEARVLAFDTAVALRCAGLHVPDPRSDRDAMIAATAMVHGLTVATRNLADFALTGVKLVDPWKTTPPSAP